MTAHQAADDFIFGEKPSNSSERLPPHAKMKLAAMREAKDDSRALQQMVSGKLQDLRERREQVELEVSRLQRSFDGTDGAAMPFSKKPLEAAKAKLAKLDEERARLREQDQARTAVWNAHGLLISRIENYLAELPQGSVIRAASFKAPKRTDKLLASIEAIRSTIATLKADRRDILMAPQPSSQALAFAKEWVAQKAEAGRPRLFGILDGGSSNIDFPAPRLHVEATVAVNGGQQHGVARGYAAGAVDAVALQCWMNPDAVLAALERDIAEIAEDARALDPATRAFKDDEVSKQILDAEREEEALIELALADNLAVTRRADADVRAILGLAGDLPEER
ncbi:MAG: hypothetical protein EOS05_10315 [Mesorhizobium sp.]|nr:MAG: hypothetical protein EOS05_10315 [Mesorhizobium sp.]